MNNHTIHRAIEIDVYEVLGSINSKVLLDELRHRGAQNVLDELDGDILDHISDETLLRELDRRSTYSDILLPTRGPGIYVHTESLADVSYARSVLDNADITYNIVGLREGGGANT